jgi:hypothetical protein
MKAKIQHGVKTSNIFMEDGFHDMVILEIWNHDTFSKVCFLLKYGYKSSDGISLVQ